MNETCDVNKFDYIESLKNAGKLWYIVNPYESSFENIDDVPDYYLQVWLPFFALVILEHVILYSKNEASFRLNDHVTSLSHWLFQESVRIASRGAEHWAYVAIYENYRIFNLAWDNVWTWYIAVIGVDFFYYWVHRANHEVHFLWAQHQVHHSSEEFNLVIGLRQSIFQHWSSFMFYLPLALFLPPSHFVAHHQFNLIYQLWIHTTVVKDLGILEFVMNTPKHHRVHHGCNLYCLDKNYGGLFIIWDRLFGTFMEEKSGEKIIFGLVSSARSFNPLYLQTFYTKALIEKISQMTNFSDKLAVFWKGPSWFPGAPRLGLDEFKINVTSRSIYDVRIPTWKNIYVAFHFCIVFCTYMKLWNCGKSFSIATSGVAIANNVFALTAVGMLLDDSKYAAFAELARCTLFLNVARFRTLAQDDVVGTTELMVVYAHIASCCLWVVYISREFKFSMLLSRLVTLWK